MWQKQCRLAFFKKLTEDLREIVLRSKKQSLRSCRPVILWFYQNISNQVLVYELWHWRKSNRTYFNKIKSARKWWCTLLMSVLERQRYVDFYESVDNVVYETRFRTARIVTQRKPCLKRQKPNKKERKQRIFEFCIWWHCYKESQSVDSGACHLSPLPISVSCGLCWVLSLNLSCIFCSTKIRKQNKRFPPLVIVKINCILMHMNCSEEGLTLAELLSWSRSYSEVFDLLIH